jgi:hypothetical protein
MVRKWIQAAKVRKCGLHKQLGVSAGEYIPTTLLRKVKTTPVGTTIRNPTMIGMRIVNVTPLLKRRVNFALNVRK